MSRQNVIDTAKAENGTKENPPTSNKTKYGEWYGMNGVPWCAIFVSWVFDKAGYALGRIDSPKGYHYCPSAFNFWKSKNQLTSSPKPGDIVLYDWNGDGLSDHTGIFVQWVQQGSTFTAWEGNTSFDNQSDGGQVMLRTRQVQTVKAFVNPGVYGDGFVSLSTVLKKGDQGAEVTHIQKWLYDLKYVITVDGDFGAATEKVIKQFQKEHGLDISGVVNEIVRGAIEAEVNKPKIADHKTVTGSYIRKGDVGAAVVVLQNALNKKGARPALDPDGVFGSTTFISLKAFQKKNKLSTDGVAGPETWKALGVKVF